MSRRCRSTAEWHSRHDARAQSEPRDHPEVLKKATVCPEEWRQSEQWGCENRALTLQREEGLRLCMSLNLVNMRCCATVCGAFWLANVRVRRFGVGMRKTITRPS